MEGEAAALATVYMEYMEAAQSTEKLTASAPEGFRVQESNADLTARTSPISQHQAILSSALATPISNVIVNSESSAQLVSTEQSPKSKHNSENSVWRKGLEISILTAIIFVVWTIFSIPTIFYALQPKIREVS